MFKPLERQRITVSKRANSSVKVKLQTPTGTLVVRSA